MTEFVIDCSNICYMSYHTTGDLSWEDKKTGTIFGFLLQIFKLAMDYDTCKFIFCWDSRKRYRKEVYAGYKVKERSPVLDKGLLYSQIASLRQNIIPTLGFKYSYIQTGYEADDLIACIARGKPGVTIVSSDSDLWQLLDDCVIYNPRSKKRIFSKSFEEAWGIAPKEWIEVKAIAGCESDSIPGVEGAGEFKAIRYLKGELPEGKIKDRIDSSKKLIDRNRKLVALPFGDAHVDTSDIDFDKETFRFETWIDLFREHGFYSFMNNNYLKNWKTIFMDKDFG